MKSMLLLTALALSMALPAYAQKTTDSAPKRERNRDEMRKQRAERGERPRRTEAGMPGAEAGRNEGRRRPRPDGAAGPERQRRGPRPEGQARPDWQRRPEGEARPARPDRAQGQRPGGDAPRAGQQVQAAMRLEDLTQDQRTALKQLADQFKSKSDALRESVRTTRDELTTGSTPEQRRAAREKLGTEMRTLNDEIAASLNAILTPEQVAKLKEAGPARGPRPAGAPGAVLPGSMPPMDGSTTGSATMNRDNPSTTTSAATAATTGTQAVTPF